jgi:phosphatidylethanolamine/phosphatidyl-N-methylethanolamine N-methyltransferase
MSLSNEGLRRAYARLATVYDLIFGETLQPGRVSAVRSISGRPGLRVLEVGIGTALTATLYPRDWKVIGVDLSAPMLAKARQHLEANGLTATVKLALADAEHLPFEANSFDVVIAPYVMSVVPNPAAVGRELRRVCAPDGRIIILNHFLSEHPIAAWMERLLLPVASRIGFRTDLSLQQLIESAGLEVTAVHKVNRPAIWTLVTCTKGPAPTGA